MSRLLPAWRASLRLALRSITRAKGRSALVTLMVGAPVALAVILTTLNLTQDISPKENVPARIGSTQAIATYLGGKVDQDPSGLNYSGDGREPTPAQREAVAGGLAALTDAAIIPITRGSVSLEGHSRRIDVFRTDFTRPGTRGLIRLDKGRVPATASEVVISQNLSDDGKLVLGSDFTVVGGAKLTVVGIGDIGSVLPSSGVATIATLPSAIALAHEFAAEFLIDRKSPVTWEQVQDLNEAGFVVESREVINNPPDDDTYDSGSNGLAAVARLVVISVMIEVILLAGPAFAVGVRRQRRELALIATAGGSPRDIRRVVIAQAALLGFGASVVGAFAGLLIARAIGARETLFSTPFGPFEWSWPLTMLAVLLGSAAAMIAAYAPARQVSKEPLPTVLAGRRLEAGSRAGWPVFGLVVALVGLALTFDGARAGESDFGIATGSIFVVVGVVFMIPMLIRFFAHSASVMPLPIRLALRDTARHTSRSGPAIAAVMAAVAGIVALGIGGSSDQEQQRRDYDYSRPEGTAVIDGGSDLDTVTTQVHALLPDRTLTPLLSDDTTPIVIVTPGCSGEDCSWYPMVPAADGSSESPTVQSSIVAADGATLKAWGVDLTPAQATALEQGKALVPALGRTGPGQTLELRVDASQDADVKESIHTLSVVTADLGMGYVPSGRQPMLANMVVSPETAEAFALPLSASRVLISGTISNVQEKALKTIIKGDGGSVLDSSSRLDVERGYQSDAPFILLLLALIGGAAVLIGTLSATGLALNDARPDFATLNAIGAAPVTRRVMAAAQALTIGGIGVGLGLIIGFLPGVLSARSLTDYGTGSGSTLDLPWMLFGILAIVVPLLAALVSGLFIRNNNVAVRRVAG